MKGRNLEYENKFRRYLFSMTFKIHKEICENINVKPNIPSRNKYEEGFDILYEYFDSISDEEKPEVNRRLKEIGL